MEEKLCPIINAECTKEKCEWYLQVQKQQGLMKGMVTGACALKVIPLMITQLQQLIILSQQKPQGIQLPNLKG